MIEAPLNPPAPGPIYPIVVDTLEKSVAYCLQMNAYNPVFTTTEGWVGVTLGRSISRALEMEIGLNMGENADPVPTDPPPSPITWLTTT